jgi:hypothetical protein
MLGKYTTVMSIFLAIGFQKIDLHLTTAFTYMHDPDVNDDISRAWAESESE